MGRRPKNWVKFSDIPTEFVYTHCAEIENACDNETQTFCYCGRLATGLHINTCRQYRKHYMTKMEELYNDNARTAST